MNIFELLSHLRSMDIKLFADGGKLRYSDPKEAMTTDLRSKIIERKTEILELLDRRDSTTDSVFETIYTVPREHDLPLSFAQQRLWFLDQLEPQNSTYNISRALRMEGLLNVDALENALESIVERHESIRTTFNSVDGVPVQVIAEKRSLDLPIVDLSMLQASEREEEALRLVKEEMERPFDLSGDLMLRARLLKMDTDDHIFIFVMHHIASDGWSMGILFREFAALYEAFSTGKPASLPELLIQYADFAVWQRKWLQGNVLNKQLSYWENQLKGAPPVLELPSDRPRPPVRTYGGDSQSISLPLALADSLKALSIQERASLFMTLLAAFDILLYRYTGQADIVVGTPIANRNRMEIEGIVGFFVNTLVLRTDLSGDPTFRELLGRVREVALQAYVHQDMPFEKLVEELEPERKLSYNPLFQVMFALQNMPTSRFEISNLSITPVRIRRASSKFDLALSMGETDQDLRTHIEYNTDLFEEPTIARMMGHFQNLLEGIAEDPDKRISKFPILTEAERHQLLVEWSGSPIEYPEGGCIHQLFEAQAEQVPDATAVVVNGKQLTYRELNHRANQLSHYLKNLGIGPDIPVGVIAERSLDMIVGLMAILKAGGAYVPMDPLYPRERLAFMLEDTGVPVLLTQEALLAGLPDHKNLHTVCLDRDWEAISHESADNPASEVRDDNLAYIMYTSGSTGKPKGVMITHRNVVGFLYSYLPVTLDTERRIGTSVATFSFDTSVEEIFSPLCFGGEVHLISPEQSTNVEYFANYLVENKITTSYILPDFIPGVAHHLRPMRDRLCLKCMITGLAPKKQHVLQSMRDVSGKLRILNAYGPTEVTYGATAFEFESATEPDWNVPIGKPFPNYEVYVVDANLQPVPIGVPGELLIGGIGLARGYLNRPELTAEKFVFNPFSSDLEARLYRTGDMVRYLPDGNIDFLGRVDNQVKIRGFRIELGEIETILGQHPSVLKTVVMAREDNPDDKRLVAYIVPDQGSKPTIDQLRSFLKEQLPDYMIPSAFVFLESFPVAPNGKIDRRALPAPDWSRPDLGKDSVAPRTPTEKALADIWIGVLRVERVGIHDNFFELGGHSLLATQVISRVRKMFQVEVTLRSFFQWPTIADMAAFITQKKTDSSNG